jgi:hypothetical protein
MRAPWWFPLVVLTASACGPRPIEPGLYVTVEIPRGFASKAVRVLAKGDGVTKPSGCMPVSGKPRLKLGLVQADLPSTIRLEATGYADEACAALAEPSETDAKEARFRPGVILEATLTLRRLVPPQEIACANGLDDDGDGDTDCADFDCNARTCTTGNLCVTGLTCQDGQCRGGTPVACNAPPSPCFMAAGICVLDAGCRYAPNAGVGCDDRDPCTATDTCQLDGACVGAPITCSTPPGQCFAAPGACVSDGGCRYAPTPNAACDDRDSCTTDDRCDAVGGCAGTRTPCPPRECQVASGQCEADGGCRYDNLDAGTACGAGGVCNLSGGCVPAWPYIPTNFRLTQIPTLPDAGVVLDCGETVVDTSGARPTVTNWCTGQPLFGWGVIGQDGGPEAMVLSFRDLDVGAAGTLVLRGTRPAIIAAAGRVRVLGTVAAEAGAQACAAQGRGGSPSLGSGGAGGGGFGSPGGAGGDAVAGALGAAGGGLTGAPTLSPLRGGCPGGIGGNNGMRSSTGGGALQVSATGDVTIAGVVAAPGQGGSGGALGAGGNGAGSGGAVLLEGLQVVLVGAAAVTANGGAGGEGGTLLAGNDGADGARATATPAPGGQGGNLGAGNGGAGAAGGTSASAGGSSLVASGGGGGGGAGRLRFNAALGCSLGPQAVVSPAATSNRPDAGCP